MVTPNMGFRTHPWVPNPLIPVLLFPLSPFDSWRIDHVALLACTPGHLLPSCEQVPYILNFSACLPACQFDFIWERCFLFV